MKHFFYRKSSTSRLLPSIKPKLKGLAGIGNGFGFGITGGGTAGQFGKYGGPAPGFLVVLDQQP